jgi:pimeloyl-ACP methyl ester carboxylesterase
MRMIAAVALACALMTSALAQDPAEAKPAFIATEVSIPIAGESEEQNWAIAGTLSVPGSAKPEKGWPAALFISGSGSQPRDGVTPTMDLGTSQVLAALAADFVVLSTDDRGVGKTPIGPKGIKPAEIGYQALISDARAALNFLRARAEVDPAHVYIIGHSEGGLTAPLLAVENEWVAGVVCMAGIGRNMYDVIYEQVEDANAVSTKAVREANMKIQKEIMDAVKEGREPDFNVAGEATAPAVKLVWGQIGPVKLWWKEHFAIDVAGLHAKLKCPVLVAQGAADFQVKPEKDGRQIVKNLAAGACKDITFKLYDDLDHLFKPCGGRKSTMAMYAEKRDVSAAFIADLTAWLKQAAKRAE